ncbi:DUF2160 family membrane protein [[Eubacterium] cellulosolvens]
MLEWMFWTTSTLIFLGAVILFFSALIIIDLKNRSVIPKKGFLPFATTRGDRIFLGMAVLMAIGILWLKFVPIPMRYSIIAGIIAVIIFVIWG